MTPASFVRSLQQRGLRVALSAKGRLRVEPRGSLSAEDRSFLRANTPSLVAYLRASEARDLIARRNRDATEQELREEFAAMDRRAADERALQRAMWLVGLDDARFNALIDAGRVTAEDVELRAALHEEAERQQRFNTDLRALVGAISELLGTRIVAVNVRGR